MFAVMVHSYRGGTGKTILALNLAAAYAKNRKVCLLDYDFSAPGLYGLLEVPEPDFWVNDFLNGDCDIDEVVSEVHPNLHIGFANPNVEAIRDMVGKSRSWQTEALQQTISLRETLTEMDFDTIIFDTPPGLAYSAINAVIASDIVALVMRLESIDILGTKETMKGVYELLEKPSFIVVNMVLPTQKAALSPTLEKIFGDHQIEYIPCLCDVRGYIAQGKQILIDEEFEYSDAILNLSRNIESFANR